MTQNWFRRDLPNGQSVNRSWLVYSPSKKVAYCFCCILFPHSSANHRSSLEVGTGFSAWKKPEKLTSHEGTDDHRKAFTTWKDAEIRLKDGMTIDWELQNQVEQERQRWRSILKRVVHTIKFLATQNLALRGHHETISTDPLANSGNFLSLLAFLAHYDPPLKQHPEFAAQNPGKVSYLSPKIQNEFIVLLANKVRQHLIDNILEAKYFGMLFDTTLDLGHREQMSYVLRYVKIDYETKTVSINESFLGFFQIHDKSAKGLEASITGKLESDNIDLNNCRSQCYDNAAVMAGHLSGVQQRIVAKNPKALFLNCDNHSLNLCGVHAASAEVAAVAFFGTVESLYLFFSRSTQRWDRLVVVLPVTVKRECATRWSSRTDAVQAIYDGVDAIADLLEELSADNEATPETRGDAVNINKAILSHNFLCLLPFWHSVLSKMDRVQKRLQDHTINFHDAHIDIQSLQTSLDDSRTDILADSLKLCEEKCSEWDVPTETRRRRKKRMPGELARDAGLSPKEEISRVMSAILDRLSVGLGSRFERLKVLDNNFGFMSLSSTILKEKCSKLSEFYNDDISGGDLFNEIQDCM